MLAKHKSMGKGRTLQLLPSAAVDTHRKAVLKLLYDAEKQC